MIHLIIAVGNRQGISDVGALGIAFFIFVCVPAMIGAGIDSITRWLDNDTPAADRINYLLCRGTFNQRVAKKRRDDIDRIRP